MKYVLDTNICIYFLKGKNEALLEHFRRVEPDEIKIPSIVKAELMLGVYKSRQKQSNLKKVVGFLKYFEILPFGADEAEPYAAVRTALEKKGKSIGPNDLLIAATAIQQNATLVSNNVREFSRIKDLKLTNWMS